MDTVIATAPSNGEGTIDGIATVGLVTATTATTVAVTVPVPSSLILLNGHNSCNTINNTTEASPTNCNNALMNGINLSKAVNCLPANRRNSKCHKGLVTAQETHHHHQYLSAQKVRNNNNNFQRSNSISSTYINQQQQQLSDASSTSLLSCQSQESTENSNLTNSDSGIDTSSCSSRSWNYQQQSRPPHSYNDLTICDSGNAFDSSIASSMTAAAAAAAAAAAVSKFEQGSTMNATNGGFTTTNWPSVIGATAEWDLSVAGRSGLDSRMINTPPYYNSSNYAAATNAAYLASYPQHYIRGSTAAAAMAAAAATPFNYLAATSCNSMNYSGYGGGNCGSNFVDYYNLNYYGTNGNSAAAAVMLGSSPSAIGGDLISSRSSSVTNNNPTTATTNEEFKSNQLRHNNNDENHFLLQDANASTPTVAIPNLSLHNSSISPIGATNLNSSTKQEKPKRAKKKKVGNGVGGSVGGISAGLGTSRTTPEPNNTRVFIWELEDLCILAANQYRSIDPFMIHVIDQIVQCAFHIAHGDELNHSNVEDAEVDESLQHQDLYLSSSILQSGNHTSPLDSGASASCSSPATSANRSQQSIDLLTGYSTLDSSTSATSGAIAAMCANSSTNAAAVAAAAAAAAATVVNHEMLEGLKRIADKYKHIRATYNAYKDDLSEFLNVCGLSAQKEDILARLREYDKHTNCQTERYRRCLRIIMERSHLIKDKCTNVVLTRETLPNAFAKLLSFDLARFVPIENVYSISKLGREAGLTHITERFRKQHAVIISSSPEFRSLAKQENIPFWMINSLRDVDALYFALDTILLVDTIVTTTPTTATTTAVNNNSNQQQITTSMTSVIPTVAVPIATTTLQQSQQQQQDAYV